MCYIPRKKTVLQKRKIKTHENITVRTIPLLSCDPPEILSDFKPLNHKPSPPLKWFSKIHKCYYKRKSSYAWGIVVLKISSMQLQVLSQISRVNFSPFRMTTFSKQFVPDRASCSLSGRKMVHLFICVQQ